MRWFFVISILVQACFFLRGQEDVHVFKELKNPLMIEMDGQFVYVSDQHSVFVFSKDNYVLKHKLCQEGQGPWEVDSTPPFLVTKGGLAVIDPPRIFLFSHLFEPSEIFKIDYTPSAWNMTMLGGKSVYAKVEVIKGKPYDQIFLYNQQDGANTLITQVERIAEDKKDFFSSDTLTVSDGEFLFVSHPLSGFFIEMFDKSGARKASIKQPSLKTKGTEEHRLRFLERLEESLGKARVQRHVDVVKKVKLPAYMPDIKWLVLDDNKIYIQTNEVSENDDKWLAIFYDGTKVGEFWLPKVHVRKATIYGGVFYFFRESEDGWALLSKKITE